MVQLNSGNFCFQLATDITAASDSEEEDEDEEDEAEREGEEAEKAPPPVAIAPAAPKNGKRPAAPKKAEPKAAEGAGSSTDLPPKRSRKQDGAERLARRLPGGPAFGIHVSRPMDTYVSKRIPMYRNVFRTWAFRLHVS